MPRLAVVIPTYNEERYLPVLLKALQRQTRQPDEIVIADVQSTDGTRTVAEQFGIRVVDGGLPSIGRNRGAAATTSELIMFLDADAILATDTFIANAVDEFVARNLDLASANVVVYGGKWIDQRIFDVFNFYMRLWARRRPHAIGTFMLVRRSMHDKIGGFAENVLFAEDQEYGLRVHAAGGKFAALNNVSIGIINRRQNRDGRLRFIVVSILAEIYMWFFGPITTNIFRYGFGYDDAGKKRAQGK